MPRDTTQLITILHYYAFWKAYWRTQSQILLLWCFCHLSTEQLSMVHDIVLSSLTGLLPVLHKQSLLRFHLFTPLQVSRTDDTFSIASTDIITKSNAKRNPASTPTNPPQELTAQILVRDCSARFSVGTDFSLQRLLAKTKSELGLSSHHCSLLLDTFTGWRNDSLLLRHRSFSTK